MIKPVGHSQAISRLVVSGYKSIEHCELEMGRLNVLIGANGAGKSNFIGFFRLMASVLDRRLQISVGQAGGPDAMLHFGRKQTQELSAELSFGDSGYRLTLTPTQDNRMLFSHEALWWNASQEWQSLPGHFESSAVEQSRLTGVDEQVVAAMRSWRVYHFHDTSSSASIKQLHSLGDNEFVREDARNLAAFLLRLRDQHREHYQRIVMAVRLVAPFFGDFHLRPTAANKDRIQLEWTELGEDEPFAASALSDGTLRFICLATVLLQPLELMPATVVIDEPELGLHPFAVTVLAGLMKSAAERHQLIVSTQSVELVDQFELEDLIVVDKRSGSSTFTRPQPQALEEWLTEYSLGDLWTKNLLGGRPGR